MIHQPGCGISGILVDERDLADCFVIPLRLVVLPGILNHERAGHVDAVQPHLIGIYLFVPVTAFGIPGMAFELSGKQVDGFFPAGLAGKAGHQEQVPGWLNPVQIVFLLPVVHNGRVGHKEIHISGEYPQIACIAGGFIQLIIGSGQDGHIVGPLGTVIHQGSIVSRNIGVCHAPGHWQGFSLGCSGGAGSDTRSQEQNANQVPCVHGIEFSGKKAILAQR